MPTRDPSAGIVLPSSSLAKGPLEVLRGHRAHDLAASLAQAREKCSENAASAIWDASIVKIVLGGASNSKDLHDLTTLIGERDEVTDSTTVGDHGSRSAQRSIRRVPIMPPDTIRTLPFGTALVKCPRFDAASF